MKSAYEIAMSRFGNQEPTLKLSAEQKASLAEIDSLYQAKIAERETFLQVKVKDSQESGDSHLAQVLRDELVRDVSGLRKEWDEKKESLRKKWAGSMS